MDKSTIKIGGLAHARMLGGLISNLLGELVCPCLGAEKGSCDSDY